MFTLIAYQLLVAGVRLLKVVNNKNEGASRRWQMLSSGPGRGDPDLFVAWTSNIFAKKSYFRFRSEYAKKQAIVFTTATATD